MEPRRYLFVMWEGGGNVPLQLGVARKLVARGHQVCVLTEPAVRRVVLATGASYRWFSRAPHRQDRAREHDLVRDFDARTPIGTFAPSATASCSGPREPTPRTPWPRSNGSGRTSWPWTGS